MGHTLKIKNNRKNNNEKTIQPFSRLFFAYFRIFNTIYLNIRKYLAEFLISLKNFSFLTNEFEYIISKKYYDAPSSIVSYNSNCGRIFFFIKKLVTKSIVHKKTKKNTNKHTIESK